MQTRYSIFAILVSFSSSLHAQSPLSQDPLLGGYVLANSSEIVFSHATASGPAFTRWLWDCDTITCAPIAGTSSNYPDSAGIGTGRHMDIATGDFDGDGFDEVATAWVGTDGRLFMALEAPKPTGGGTWNTSNRRILHSLADTIQANLRLLACNVDTDPQLELLIAYWSGSGRIPMAVYEVNAQLEPRKIGSTPGILYASPAGGYAQFDISAGDFDGDSFDEFVLARTVTASVGGTPVDARLSVYDYYWPTNAFIAGADVFVDLRDILAPNQWRDDLLLSTGDYDNDGLDEAVLVYQEGGWVDLLIVAGVDLKILPISISRNLDAFNFAAGSPVSCEHWQAAANVPAGGGVSVVSSDLDMDGAAEVIVGGMSTVTIWQSTAWPAFALRASTGYNTRSGEESRRLISIADLNASASQTSWTPEVVVADYTTGNWMSGAAGTKRVRTLGVVIDTLAVPHLIKGMVQKGEHILLSSLVSRCAVATGDFDGDAIRLRSPRLITKEKFVQPLVMLNVPPTHYDVLGGTVYDVCKQYPSNYSFKATYLKGSSSTKEFSTQQTKDWSVSANIGGTFKSMLGLNFSANYGESFSKRSDSGSTIQITDQVFTSGDDYLFASVSEYAFWEYPLYAGGKAMGNVLVTIPRLSRLEWLPSKSPDAFHIEPSHEVGNVLSYMTAPGLFGSFDIESIVSADFQGYTVSEKAGKSWEVFLSQSQGTELEWTKNVGIEVGGSLSFWGIELGAKGSYTQKDVTTHRSKATRDVKVTLEVGEPDPRLGTADYKVTPLVYWSTTGALVVDYATEPTVWQYPDTSLRTWWQRQYQSRPDPALILPWRYDVEKTGDSVSAPGLRNLTRSLRISPSVARPGDTVRISVRVQNFSLAATPGPVTVRFYVGDPDSGGVPIIGLGGLTQLSTVSALPARGSKQMTMSWAVTGMGLTAATRIYALLDPDRTIEEIHETNNKGWTILTIPSATGIADDPQPSLAEEYELLQNYPNPFNAATVIPFRLGAAMDVEMKIYDVLGREVAVPVRGRMNAGVHHVVFEGARIASGVYFCRLQAGGTSTIRRILHLR